MPLRRLSTLRLIHPDDLTPSTPELKIVSAFNPGSADLGDDVMLLVRIAEQPAEERGGMVGLPRYERGALVIDWVPETNIEFIDPRVVRVISTGAIRLTFVSHLRMMRLAGGREVASDEISRFMPELEIEEFGVEDPRFTRLGDRWYFTYVAVSRHGAGTALASTIDFKSYQRHGIIFVPENKDVLLFPEKIGGRYACLHRPNPSTHFRPPEMWVARSDDLRAWSDHEPVKLEGAAWANDRVGGGIPPIRIEQGWLEIYHGNRKIPGQVGEYSAGALLLDADQPHRVLGRSHEALMMPEADFEVNGFVPRVVFPTGLADRGETVLVYYGAADTCVGVVEWSRQELLRSLGPA